MPYQPPAAPVGAVPKRGELWLPVGDRALAGAFYLVPTARARPLVPSELDIVSVWPGCTVGFAFIGDYGPGSTVVYHEFGILPALVRFGGVIGFWNSFMAVDSTASLVGGRHFGVPKIESNFQWIETRSSDGVAGECSIVAGHRRVASVRYRQGAVPLPGVPIRLLTLLDDMLFLTTNRFSGRARTGDFALDIDPAGPAAVHDVLGPQLLSVVVTDWRGRMGDRMQVVGFLPHRNPHRLTEADAPADALTPP